MADINSVTLSGNLTRDPETRQLSGDNSVTNVRLANNIRKKVGGEWVDAPNYFDLVIWGKHGETITQYLAKGDGLVVTGRLEWREWEADDGTKRQNVSIVVADSKFLPKASRDEGPSRSAENEQTTLPVADDDDIPF